MKAEHFLITRFDYPDGYPHLKRRIELFNKYTLPSVKKQVNQRFKWIILSSNPEWFEGIDCIVTRISGLKDILASVKSEWVITSRVDNDDALHPRYIAEVQAHSEPKEMVIDFRGYRYNLSTGKVVKFDSIYEKKPSPFSSLIQKAGDVDIGVLKFKHGDLSDHFPVKRLNQRRWIQMIHETNKLMKWSDAHEPATKKHLWI